MEELLATQMRLQRSIERALENFKKTGRNRLTVGKIRSKIDALQDLWSKYQDNYDRLSVAAPPGTQAGSEYLQTEQLEATEDLFLNTMDAMKETLAEYETPVSPLHSSVNSSARHELATTHLAPLPPISLPPFDGNPNEWEQFRDRFTSLIRNNKDLSDFARMHYLTSCLKGRAREVIANLPVTADNYAIAWKTLTARYENKRRLLNSHLASLLNLPSIARESAADLQDLHNKVSISIASLKNLDRTSEELWDDILAFLVVQKLDPNTRKAWNIKTSDSETPPSYGDLDKFLVTRIRAYEEFTPAATAKCSRLSVTSIVHVANSTANNKSQCTLCKANYFLNSCSIFISKSPGERRDIVKRANRCFNCLSTKHSVSSCPSKYSCRTCQKRHHSMLHVHSDSPLNDSEIKAQPSSLSHPPESAVPVHSLGTSTNVDTTLSTVLLATAVVNVQVSNGRAITLRALIDQGSDKSFIAEHVAQALRAPRIRIRSNISVLGGIQVGTGRHAIIISISPRNSFSPTLSTSAIVIPSVTSYVPTRVTTLESFDYLSNLTLADPEPTSPDRIDLLIGSDLYSELILDGVRKGPRGSPLAQNTVFGWIISGNVSFSETCDSQNKINRTIGENISHINTHHCTSLVSLEQGIRKFWEIEEVPARAVRTPLDEKCERHFRETHSRDPDGRYVVRLPFKIGLPIEIGESRTRAVKMLHNLLHKFKSNPELEREYTEFLSEYERLGHMKPAPTAGFTQVAYLPHHAVTRENSETTHLRVVFNASSVTSIGSSLNDQLLAGPKLQADITSVLLKWRQFPFVYCADIAKMYRQIRVDHRDVNFQRIIWLNSNASLVDYCLLTVTYGMSCAPFLALRVLQQLAVDEGREFPLAVAVLRDNIYVDDILFGADNPEILKRTRDQLISLLRRGQFELRKWASNSSILLDDIDSHNHGLACSKSLAPDEQLKILGIVWNPSHDAFEFQGQLPGVAPTSKRTILSALAKIYDPLGWITPVTVSAKIFMQHMWKRELDWDAEINDELRAKWELIYSGWSRLSGIQIPRWIKLGANTASAELHGFADASTSAYAAVVYLKVVSASGDVATSLLTGKSRVAPLAAVTIPRL